MKEPTDLLREEHALILRALDVLEIAAARVAGGDHIDDAWWTRTLAWLRGFADRNHHAKEERLLFPALERAGVPADGGPIGVMLAEHAEGRALMAAMQTATGAERAAAARRYMGLLRAHIDKENGVLFPLADVVLAQDARDAVAREFGAVADALGRDGSLADASTELAALAAALPAPAPAAAG